LNKYLRSLINAASDWMDGVSSKDYPGYDKILAGLSKDNFDTQVAKGAAWVGNPEDICDAVSDYQKLVGGFEIASLQVNFHDISLADAERSVRMYSKEVIPRVASLG